MARFRIARALYKSFVGSGAKIGVTIVFARARRNVVSLLAGLCVERRKELSKMTENAERVRFCVLSCTGPKIESRLLLYFINTCFEIQKLDVLDLAPTYISFNP